MPATCRGCRFLSATCDLDAADVAVVDRQFRGLSVLASHRASHEAPAAAAGPNAPRSARIDPSEEVEESFSQLVRGLDGGVVTDAVE